MLGAVRVLGRQQTASENSLHCPCARTLLEARAHPARHRAGSFVALTQTHLINAGGLEPAISAAVGAVAFAVLNIFSQKIPYSQREHLVLVPEAIEQQIGAKSFAQVRTPPPLPLAAPSSPHTRTTRCAARVQVKQQYGRDILPSSHPDAQLVERIADRVVTAVKKADNDVDGYTSHMRDYDWEVFAVRSKTPNAFVVPGGKIVVFTGALARPPTPLCLPPGARS